MSVHPLVPFDQALIDEVATRMDLRRPNVEALEAVAGSFDSAGGAPFEAVCDLATAVGKTYLAAGLIDYLASSGVRNVLFVTPGRTILNKTAANFTPGHPKSVLDGMEWSPTVVTVENFDTGATGSALRDDTELKLFVFTVQSLINPRDDKSRRTRKYQEWIGTDLYEWLRAADDLVVIADECHIYAERAAAFHKTITDLDAMATVGLTATPADSDQPNVIYHYPLARAIADRYVKTPVLVGRKDEASDVETRLRDGLALLAAKQQAAERYTETTGAKTVNPVMFVVADRIDEADAVSEILAKPGLLGDDYDKQVLVIHSEAADDALARLERVEEPDSPVRVIVSVSMLKEGWDCKNIFVICSLRPSISEVLTEQTLGRGLRLPWGAYTDVELLDTVEVISHERYEQLLAKAGVLLEGLVDTRSTDQDPEPETPDDTDTGDTTTGDTSSGDAGTDAPASGEVGEDIGPGGTGTGSTSEETGGGGDTTAGDADVPSEPEPGRPAISPFDDRLRDAAAEAEATAALTCRRVIDMPTVTVTVVARAGFSLSNVADDEFTKLGRQLADVGGGDLSRKVLDVVEDPSVAVGYRLVPRDADESVAASTAQLPLGGAQKALADAIFTLDIVTENKTNHSAAKRLAAAVVAGAGSEELLASYLATATKVARTLVGRCYQAVPPERVPAVSAGTFAPVRVNSKPLEPNKYLEPFSSQVAYSGYTRGQFDVASFDSRPERTLANLLDGDNSVEVWTRIQRGELTILWDNGQYSPDFYAEVDGTHYLLEVKADKDLDTEVVTKKAAAAQDWARLVTDDGDFGTWKYLLIGEGVLATAKTVRAALNQSANR